MAKTEVKTDRRYTKDHEWAQDQGGALVIGITAHAVDQLGDITLVNVDVKVGDTLAAGKAFGTIESVKTLSETRILALSRTDFLSELRRNPDLAMAVIQELTRRVRQMDEQASSLSFQRVRDRTKGLLLRLAREDSTHDGWRITPSLTHQQIADMIGTSRETVTRVLKVLKEQGWLAQEGKHYLVCSTGD